MKKLDEMDRNIQLRSEELGYRVGMLSLCMWTLFNSWQTLFKGAKYQPQPGLILCLAVCVQSFSQMAMKQKMVSDDEEYKEPNKLLWTIVTSIILTAIILFFGTYIIIKA